jgi:uncharacterized protein GlcG (DUF336 family)
MNDLAKMQQQIIAQKNRNLALEFPVLDANDVPFDLTGFKVTFSVGNADGNVLFARKDTEAGGGDAEIEIIDAVGGVLRVYIVPENTADMTPGQAFAWDLTLEKAGYGIVSVAGGEFVLVSTVT